VNKSAYNTGVVAALVDAGLLKSADANALAERLRLEPEIGKRPRPPKKRESMPDYEEDFFTWGGKGSVSNSLLQNLGINFRGPEDETFS